MLTGIRRSGEFYQTVEQRPLIGGKISTAASSQMSLFKLSTIHLSNRLKGPRSLQ